MAERPLLHWVGERVGEAAGGASGGQQQAVSWHVATWVRLAQACMGIHVPWANGWLMRWQEEPQVASSRPRPGTTWHVPTRVRLARAYVGQAGMCLRGSGWCVPTWIRLVRAYVDQAGACLRGSGWHVPTWVRLARAYVGQASACLRGSGWRVPMQVRLACAYAGQAGAGIHIPWGNRQVRQQGEPQVASGRPHLVRAYTGWAGVPCRHAHTPCTTGLKTCGVVILWQRMSELQHM